ncbi:uncharacterized protein LOC110901434 [Helianthus annuus]|uniref:uncharacterized protein LOC110901434 n=1 Tax=Helianthus annuus TaxID=4232 RepID=UPI000B8EF4E3|nr:uncharacterized protein LOC110901434 [Helianthus annuus]
MAETKQGLNDKLEEWRATLEGSGLRISLSKTEYLYCEFSEVNDDDDTHVSVDGHKVPQTTKSKYLGSFVQMDGEIDSDVVHCIQARWCRWRATTRLLDHQYDIGTQDGGSKDEDVKMDVWAYKREKWDLHMVFIDLEKAYDIVPRRVIWDSLECRGVPKKYIDIIKDIYVRTETSVRALVGDTDFFPVEVGLHQGSALSPFLFAVVLDELSKPSIQEPVPRCLLFADDIVLVGDSKQSLNERLEEWRATLEGKGLRICRSKIEYLYCNCNASHICTFPI